MSDSFNSLVVSLAQSLVYYGGGPSISDSTNIEMRGKESSSLRMEIKKRMIRSQAR